MEGDGLCVLVAEDEPVIAEIIEVSLNDEGLSTTVAHTGRQALSAIETRPRGFHLLVTDIRMGSGPNGWEIAHAARVASPGIGVIYITGDSMAAWRAKGVPDSVLIKKPFVPAQIVTAAMTLLNRTSGPLST